VDIAQLEAALLALGYGKQGSGYPDAHWDATTTDAVKQFQEKLGASTDGVLSLGEVVFTAGDVHVAKLNTHVGAQATPNGPVMTVSATARVVTLDLDPLDRDLIAPGAPVQVELPSGAKASGKVTAVGTSLEMSAEDKQVYKVQVALDDPAQAGDLALAPVTVRYAVTVAAQVLSVPVSAILGTPGGGYAVDVRTPEGEHRRVPVQLGAWGDGYVQVTGELAAGDTVEVPK
jgi:peptidoglycan hydrolase-like protein with peptidoglycan-binding domain